jgi:hypothetical protein
MPDRANDITGHAQLSADALGRAMERAWRRIKRTQSRLWSDWMVVGEGLLAGRAWALQTSNSERPEGRAYNTAFNEWLTRFRVHDMDASDRARLLKCMEERPAIEEWRATLTDRERRNLNSPSLVWRKWSAANQVRRPRRQRNATRAFVEREQFMARIDELTQELETVRSQDQPMDIDQLVDAVIARIAPVLQPSTAAVAPTERR